MSLIAMAVHDTEENGRSELTYRTLKSLTDTVDWNNHRLIIIDNGSCKKTKNILALAAEVSASGVAASLPIRFRNYRANESALKVITLPSNIGTAAAINLAWRERKPGEHAIKMDNDCIIHQSGWVEEMEAAITAEPQIGIVGLKRKDLWEFPGHTEKQYKSELIMLPHIAGELWIVAERVKHVMGTCQMYNSALLDKIGYLYQPSKYGYDDTISSYRSEIAGFINVFLPHINIDHIDPGGTDYTKWKQDQAAEYAEELVKIVRGYLHEGKSIYYDGGFTE